MKEYIEALLEIAQSAEEFKPAVSQTIKAVQSYGPEIYGFMERFCQSNVDLKAMCVKRYIEQHGFTREEAILMTLDQWSAFAKGMQKSQTKK